LRTTEQKSSSTFFAGLVYEDDVLQFAGQEEGRIRYKPAVGNIPADFAYDYFISAGVGKPPALPLPGLSAGVGKLPALPPPGLRPAVNKTLPIKIFGQPGRQWHTV
jgi:hypothetical protein